MECEIDSDCRYTDICHNGQCINPCILENKCAVNAECYGANHRAACKCGPGYYGNPDVHCERAECTSSYDCPSNLECYNNRCINPCTYDNPCAQNAECFVQNHVATCRCPETLPSGNPYSYCERRPPQDQPECVKDVDCPSKLACIKKTCVDPCTAIRPCLENARCSVFDNVPVRTMACTCPDGWITDKDGFCRQSMLKYQFSISICSYEFKLDILIF